MKEGLPLGRTTQQNKITTPELIDQISQENKELYQEYIAYLHSIDRSKTTIYQYEQDLNIFFVWNLQKNKNKFFTEITKRDFIKYQTYLISENGNSSNRVRRLKSVISSMSKYIEDILDDEFPNYKNVISHVPSSVNQPTREKTVMTKEQVDQVLDLLVEQKEYQKACLFALACFSGSRKSELLRFKVSYFKPEYIVFGALYKTPENIKTKGRGSQGHMLPRFTLAKDFDPYLKLWMDEREKLQIDSDWLFVTKNTNTWIQTKSSTVDKWFEKLSEQMGFPIYCHALRHHFFTELKRHNIPDSVVIQIAGWKSSEMLKIYNDLTIDDELGKYFDEGGIKKDIKDGKINDLK